MYDDDFDKDEIDEIFEKLDNIYELGKKDKEKHDTEGAIAHKYYVGDIEIIKLMAQESNRDDVRISQEASDRWSIEVLYRGVRFITITNTEPNPTELEAERNDYE